LPVGIHAFGYSGFAMTNGGWPSFYIEEASEHATSAQAVVTSMIMEGLFERYRDLKVALIECGFGWLPALGWRLDKHWKRLRQEVPHLARAPSEYIREHFYVTTQPMEETEDSSHVLDAMRWIGIERILFASDYPHWDFDNPEMAIPPSLAADERRMIFGGNARKLFGLD
jgi:predicted TIM-barrel fold metal-dependent hydrolase